MRKPRNLEFARGFSLVETLVALLILSIVGVSFTSLLNLFSSQYTNVADHIEAANVARRFLTVMTDDSLCDCQLNNSPAMVDDVPSPSSVGRSKIVTLPKLVASCADPNQVFAQPGQSMSKTNSAFTVKRIAIRDLKPTGRRNGNTAQLDEYTGAVYIEFTGRIASVNVPRPIKASRIFTTSPDGTRLAACSSETVLRASAQITNSPYATTLLSAIASCPVGYSVISGAYRGDGRLPACPTTNVTGTMKNTAGPVILESAPVIDAQGLQGWRITATCSSFMALATCRRGHQ